MQKALDEPAGEPYAGGGYPAGRKKDGDLEVNDDGKDGSEDRVRVAP